MGKDSKRRLGNLGTFEPVAGNEPNQWLLVGDQEQDPFSSSTSRRNSSSHHHDHDNTNVHQLFSTKRFSKILNDETSQNPFQDITDELPTSLNIEDAANRDDIKALRQGLQTALGTTKVHGKWLAPTTQSEPEKQETSQRQLKRYSNEDATIQSSTGYEENIPLQDLSTSTHLAVPKKFGPTLSPTNKPNLLIFTPDLEAGIGNNSPLPSPTPKKFTDAITRLSERIAAKSSVSQNVTGASNISLISAARSNEGVEVQPENASMLSGRSEFPPEDMIASTTTATATHNTDIPASGNRGLGLFLQAPLLQHSKVSVNTIDSPSKSDRNHSVTSLTTAANEPNSSFLDTSSQKKVPYQPYTPKPLADGSQVLFNDPSAINPNTEHPILSFKQKSPADMDLSTIFLFGNSLKLFSPNSRTRKYCFKLTQKKSINIALLVLLFMQVGLLSSRQWNPEKLYGYMAHGYDAQDVILIVINVIYTIDVVSKIIAFGLYDDKIMYKECGLPYPKSSLSVDYKELVLYKLLDQLGIIRFFTPRRFHKRRKDGQENEALHVTNNNGINPHIKDVDLGEDNFHGIPIQTPVDLSAKYLLPLHHKKTRFDVEDDVVNEVTRDSTFRPTPVLRNHTFLNKETPKNISQLHLKRAFLRGSWQRIDFISMVSFWISLLLSIGHYDAIHHLTLFRTLSCLRILRLCNLTTGTSTILDACKNALPKLIDVSLFIFCFWVLFGIIGVQSFYSSFRRHCVWTNPDDPLDTYTGSKMCGSWLSTLGDKMSYLYPDMTLSGVIKGYRCPVNSKCIEGDNPYGGSVNFDNIFNSIELVFVVMSANTFTDLMYDTMDSDNMAACLFFIFGIFFLTVWLINVFISVIVTSFEASSLALKETRAKNSRFSVFPKVLINEGIENLKQKHKAIRIYYHIESFSLLIIAVDLFVQCFRSSDMTERRRHILYRIEALFTAYFLLEIVVRFLVHVPSEIRAFFKSRRNIFDLILAIITTVIIIQPIKEALGQVYYWLTVFQIMRFYRIVISTKLTSKLWFKIVSNIKAIYDLTLFYFILLYLTSILVARFFEGVITNEIMSADSLQFGLQTLPNAFIGLYVITSTENWTEILYALQEYAPNQGIRVIGSAFLIGWFIVSNMIVLNIFIAVIASTLQVSEAGKRRAQLLQFITNMTTRLQTLRPENGVLTKIKSKLFRQRIEKEDFQKAVINLLLSGTAVNDFLKEEFDDDDIEDDETWRGAFEQDDDTPIKVASKNKVKRYFQEKISGMNNIFRNPFHSTGKINHKLTDFNPGNFAKRIISERNNLISKQNEFLKQNPNYNEVFWLMKPNHFLRRRCQRIVKSSYGERIDGVVENKTYYEVFVSIMFISTILLVVFTSYLTPLIRNQLNEKHGKWNWGSVIEISFTALFTIEFLIKVFADGLIFTPNAYMRSSWNLIDMIVLIALWVEVIAFLKDDGDLSRVIRGLKALRALRLLTISETAKNNFQYTLISGFGKIVNAGIISLCLLFPFSIWGLNIFNGRLGYCIDGSSDITSCVNEYANNVYQWDIVSPNAYVDPILEFNRWTTSFATLFEIVSLEGWVDLLYDVMQSTGVGTPQQTYASPYNGLFVILFNFTSTIFILTLFVSVIILNYSRTTGRAYMTRDQRSWYEVKKILIQVKPSKRQDPNKLPRLKRFCYKMTVDKNIYWKSFLDILMFFHVLALLFEGIQKDSIKAFRSFAFITTSASYLIDITMLLIALGFKPFMKNKWNAFNAFVSYGALTTTILEYGIGATNGFVNANKLFLVAILAFLIPKSQRLSQLLRFASASLPHMLSLAFTWIVVFMVFAIAMNQIFGLTKIGPNTTNNINLRSVPKALILLFRCSFGEGWNYIMNDFTLDAPYCVVLSGNINDCGNKQYAYILFIAWNLISMYIFLNMFVSLIIDSFSYIMNNSSYIKLIQRHEIRKFKKTWMKFDPMGTGYIDPKDLPAFLHTLEGSLSFHFYSGSLEIKELCKLWFTRNNPFNPYDITVNYEMINNTYQSMDIEKIRMRRKVYENFMEEAILTMELNEDPGISFSRILLQLPLYISFDAGQCLNLIDFLERRLLLQKVEKRIHTKKVYDTMATYATRWLYLRGKLDPDDEALAEHQYVSDPNNGSFISSNEDEYEVDDEAGEEMTDDELELSTENIGHSNHNSMYEPKSPVFRVSGRKRGSFGTNHLTSPLKNGRDSRSPDEL